MLVLSRQRDETIMIGDEIEVTIVDVRGDKVRLGITAPTKVAVHRKEVYEAIKRENEQAAGLSQNGASTTPVPAELQALRTSGLPKPSGIRGPRTSIGRLGTSIRAESRSEMTPDNMNIRSVVSGTANSPASGQKSG
jgi:carbon storage regulator